jgi:hypothetical protein
MSFYFIFQFISITCESLYYSGLGPSWNYFILYIISKPSSESNLIL